MTLPEDGFPWAVDQIVDAYRGIAELAEPAQRAFTRKNDESSIGRLKIWQGSATALTDVPSESVRLIVTDPPYHDNVMYAECSDFFYVWMKRTLGDVYPELFYDELTNKDDEAVANVARFASIGGGKKRELAERDYERKMAACFREMHRVLHADGVLTVMFTHKRVEAWDTLATALIGAGFSIQSSWPVHTEFEHSLHQARKNAATSTILLVCRKRSGETGEPVWWDIGKMDEDGKVIEKSLKARVREMARERAVEFEKQGIRGVDLYISTFGPTLSIISENWPVLTSEVEEKTGKPKPLRPETALDIAREEVIALRKQGLLGSRSRQTSGRTVQFDPVTDWYLMAWDAFRAEQFPADEARKLAIALGIDLESVLVREKKTITKKQNFVALQPPKARRKRNMVDPDCLVFESWVDAVHTMMLIYQEDGSVACEQFLRQTGLRNDATFKSCLQALINAIPRTKVGAGVSASPQGKFVRPEAELLENLRLAFFDDLESPVEEEPPKVEAQMQMAFVEEEVGEEEALEEEEEEEL
jgi:adenine-specific DNA methylase